MFRSVFGLGFASLAFLGCEESAAGGGGSGSTGTETGGSGGSGGAVPCEPGTHETPDGCAADLIEWTDGPPIPERRDHHTTCVMNNADGAFLVVTGGGQDNAALFDTTVFAPIAADGTVGSWSVGPTLPQPAAGGAVAVVGDAVLFSGGYRQGAVSPLLSDQTNVMRLLPDGTFSEWIDGPEMSTTRFHHASIAVGESAYVTGGMTGSNNTNTPSVQRSVRGVDGSFGSFEELTPLPDMRSHHSIVAHDGALYISGGLRGNPSGSHESLSDVLRAPIEADGTIGTWELVGDLDVELSTHSSFVFAGQLYVAGGIEGGSENVQRVRRAPFENDGSIGAWEEVAELPTRRAHAHQTPVWNGFVYAVGGALNHDSIDNVWIGRFE